MNYIVVQDCVCFVETSIQKVAHVMKNQIAACSTQLSLDMNGKQARAFEHIEKLNPMIMAPVAGDAYTRIRDPLHSCPKRASRQATAIPRCVRNRQFQDVFETTPTERASANRKSPRCMNKFFFAIEIHCFANFVAFSPSGDSFSPSGVSYSPGSTFASLRQYS